MRIVGIMLILFFALQGCGRKGALFMPPPQPEVLEAPAQTEQESQP